MHLRFRRGDPSAPGCRPGLPSAARRPDALGSLGHNEVLEVVGRSGFGIVFRAFDKALEQSAPDSESGALFDGVFPPSPHRWPNQPWTAPEVPVGHVDSKLLAGCYLWFKRALAARTDSGCKSSWPGRVSDGAGRSNLCPQLCPVVGTGAQMGKKASRNWLLRLAF
jgi:hypothetical protein